MTEGTSLWKPAAGAVQPGPGARSENRSPFCVGVGWWWGRGLVVTRQPPQRPRPLREIALCSALWVWGLPTPNSKHLLIKTPLVRNTFTCGGRESVDWVRAPVGVLWSPPHGGGQVSMDAVLWVGDRPNFGSSRAILTCGQRGGAWPASPLPGNVALGVPGLRCWSWLRRKHFFFFSLKLAPSEKEV